MIPPTLVVSDVACDGTHDANHDCHYQVAWSINPHMQVGAVDHAAARLQHEAYVHALASAGARVIRLPFVHGAFDSVFTKDPALLLERNGTRRALLASLLHPERRQEIAARAARYALLGYEVVCGDDTPYWEGGDIVMHPSGRLLFLGHGMRTSRAAATWIERHADIAVTPLELCDPHLYHLDMALALLPDGTAIVCESAITPASLRDLERAPGVKHIAYVQRHDAMAFALNLIAVGETIVCGATTPTVSSIVNARGYRLCVSPLDQFHLAGGSAACLVATVHPEPEVVDLQATSLEHAPWTSTAPYFAP